MARWQGVPDLIIIHFSVRITMARMGIHHLDAVGELQCCCASSIPCTLNKKSVLEDWWALQDTVVDSLGDAEERGNWQKLGALLSCWEMCLWGIKRHFKYIRLNPGWFTSYTGNVPWIRMLWCDMLQHQVPYVTQFPLWECVGPPWELIFGLFLHVAPSSRHR